MIKICQKCGENYKTYFSTSKYCSYKCYWASLVGKPSKSPTKFKKGWNYRANRPALPPKKCLICNKIFKTDKANQKYCSSKCTGIAQRRFITKKCKNCGKEYSIRPSYPGKQYFCSDSCMREFQIGVKHPSWKGGIKKDKDRRKSFKNINWRINVFKRDNYTCQICGASGSEGARLEPHHLYPYSVYPEYRSCPENGITLCLKCHSKIHKIYPVHKFKKERPEVNFIKFKSKLLYLIK